VGQCLTLALTLATFVGYAVVYTLWLKPRTPQNIVIGGASGAMPPVLGWAAVRATWARGLAAVPDHLPLDAAALLVPGPVPDGGLPPGRPAHAAGHPWPELTRLHIFLYTVVLLAGTLMPFIYGMSGWIYLVSAITLGLCFMVYGFRLWRQYSEALARRTFWFSILYLSLLFAALLLDHYISPGWAFLIRP
jgi:protoheme IX farnesyltransferase